MIAANHYLVGVASAAAFKNPLLALPIAFMSHFALDALPHFGVKFSEKRGKILMSASIFDVAIIIIAVLLTLHNYPAWYVLSGFVAVSPDFAWIYRFVFKEKFGKLPHPPKNKFNDWHARIQRFESTPGGIVEIIFLLFFSLVLF